jgi:hypothetical protein
VDYYYGSSWFLANGADEVILLDGSLDEIDRVEYDGGPLFPDPTGASMALKYPALDNNVGENWCTSTTPFGDGDLGTPGGPNICSNPASVGDLVINEIMQNPDAVFDSAGEWFELFNPTSSDIDINGWTIKDDDNDSHVINNGGPLNVPAGGFLVLGRNADPLTNGGVIVDYEYSSFILANDDDEVVLSEGTIEIDHVEYDGGPLFPDPTGASMALRDPALDNNVGENWCTSTTPFGDGDLGTPGAENICNQPPDCTDAIPSIDILWPPNHKFCPVNILGVTDPDGDEVTVTIDSIFQDEPVDSTGDGNFGPDGQGIGTETAEVRAERDGAANGRVYHISFTADDGMGGACSEEVLVSVPKSQGKNGAAVDEGALFDSTVP